MFPYLPGENSSIPQISVGIRGLNEIDILHQVNFNLQMGQKKVEYFSKGEASSVFPSSTNL